MSEKIFIKNRKGQKVCVLIEKTENQKGLVFIMHGLSGFKEEVQLKTFADAFKESGFTAIRFDTTNTFGESEGNYEDATLTNYYEDLEDVIGWAKSQEWYQEPFYLIGHSMGGISVALFAQKYPEKVKSVIPASPVVSGKLSLETHTNEDLEEWEKTGWRTEISKSRGIIKKLKWSHLQDRLKYDLLERADRLTMPVLIIVGENDTRTPPRHQKILFEKLPAKKELKIIKDAVHTFREKRHLDEIKEILIDWIKQIELLS